MKRRRRRGEPTPEEALAIVARNPTPLALYVFAKSRAVQRYFTGRIAFGPAEHELFTVLQGRCRVHAADGSFQEAGPGEALFIAPGFTGSFEVLETLTKTYAIVDGDAPAA